MLDIISGNRRFIRIYSKGLINSSFSNEYFIGYGYETVLFEGESENPQAVADALKAEIARVKKTASTVNFSRVIRRSMYGKGNYDV
ncbi:MAG: hypothetical protein ACLR6O_00825 [Eubacterium sp.]